mmetsp:Transcript_7025/g.13553  ORF Transcript_7025/g.13553 Transcript_7025/m.13553 type:complete len:126 (+) Transcript_7025:196-573(+)
MKDCMRFMTMLVIGDAPPAGEDMAAAGPLKGDKPREGDAPPPDVGDGPFIGDAPPRTGDDHLDDHRETGASTEAPRIGTDEPARLGPVGPSYEVLAVLPRLDANAYMSPDKLWEKSADLEKRDHA